MLAIISLQQYFMRQTSHSIFPHPRFHIKKFISYVTRGMLMRFTLQIFVTCKAVYICAFVSHLLSWLQIACESSLFLYGGIGVFVFLCNTCYSYQVEAQRSLVFGQGHTSSQQQSWNLNPSSLGPGSMLLTTIPMAFTEVMTQAWCKGCWLERHWMLMHM